MTRELPKTFDPAEIESRWYAHWEEQGCFRPDRPDAEPFTLVNPPPNVTGSLHIGHALDNTLQDIVVRYERLRGKDALWVVGVDHAGIATQMVVERQLEERQDKRTNYSREEFVEKVWEWKEESGGQITGQLRRLGCSMDWSREQFTMSPHFQKAVTRAFVQLYNDGLIYRDKRLVNWDPKLKTAISDLEVETKDVKGAFWTFRYPLADDTGEIRVSTTRPETMLADMAVAVHPSDERYAELVARGAKVRLPLTGREIPIVADEYADPELGSGAVKITPGHDFNDFEVGRRAGIEPADMLNMFDADARVVQTTDGLVPKELVGLDRFDARKTVVVMLKERGFLVPFVDKDENEHDAEPRVIPTPFGDRGGVEIEPWLTDQWYVDAERLAQAPIEAVRSGAVEIVPKTWEKTFFNWMENIQPWCISRQLWWGHRIPAWYGPEAYTARRDGRADAPEFSYAPGDDTYLEGSANVRDEAFVASSEAEALAQARQYYRKQLGEDRELVVCDTKKEAWSNLFSPEFDINNQIVLWRDSDVLDTWFSSALWPFATLGWPEGSELLQKHYPNSLLISGFDILFFWDARMMMMGRHLTGKNPWKRLYLHGLVRAPDGQKMSKSKGNVVDPLGLIDKYGADALRFFMAAMESQGRDIKMDDSRLEGYRNFATKLWNAARFCQANGISASTQVAAPEARLAVNTWIIGELVETLETVEKALADLRFDAAANVIYHFVWDRFCDWYLELIKPVFGGDPEAMPAKETRSVAGWALDQILVMLHPFMPFVTEELWSRMGDRPDYPLITAKWPEPDAKVDPGAKAAIDWVIRLTTATRAARNELGIAPGAKLPAYVADPSPEARNVIERSSAAIERLARLAPITIGEAPEGAAMQVSSGEDVFVVPLEGVIDIEAERARLEKALAAARKERDSLQKRLDNPNFTGKAKPEAVEKARSDLAHHTTEAERLLAALERLG